jgi:hypothetical protein
MPSAKQRWILLAGVLAAGASLCLPARAADEVFDRAMPLVSGGSFALDNVNGSVTVTGWDRETVEVHAVKSAGLAADLSRVRIAISAGPEGASVLTVYPREDASVEVTYTVHVPRRVLLRQVATVNGTVRVAGVESAGALRSVNGNIEVSDSSGGMSVKTTNGDIRMNFRALTAPGPVTIETVNGSIVMGLPANVSAQIEAQDLNGDFRSELPLRSPAAYGSREIHGQLGDGGVPVRLHTVNGSIRIIAATKGA